MKNVVKRICRQFGIPVYWLHFNYREIRLVFVRLYGLLPMQTVKVMRLSTLEQLKLNLGCGDTRYPGWIGIDCFWGDAVDIVRDLRTPLPFSEATVDYCYSEHFLEHMYPEEGELHLVDIYRVLKKDGIYRVAVPDFMEFVSRYVSNDVSYFKGAFPWAKCPLDAVYHIANWHGEHRNIFDFAELERLGILAGFSKITRSEAGGSSVVELRIDNMKPQRVAESFYVEFTK